MCVSECQFAIQFPFGTLASLSLPKGSSLGFTMCGIGRGFAEAETLN